MATLTRPQEHSPARPLEPDLHVDQHRPGNRFLVITVAVLALALIGLGVWTVVDRSSTSDTAVTPEIQQLIDDYHAAWNNYDGAAFTALVTEGYRFEAPDLGASMNAVEQARFISDSLKVVTPNWHATPLGDPVMIGDGPWLVAVPTRLSWTTGGVEDHGDGMSLLTVVDNDGTLLIARHEYTSAP